MSRSRIPKGMAVTRALALVGSLLATSACGALQAVPFSAGLTFSGGGSPPPGTPAKVGEATQARVIAAYGKLPLHFEANRGQTDPRVRFLARGPGYTAALTATEGVLVLTQRTPRKPGDWRLPPGERNGAEPATLSVLRVSFLGANTQPRVAGREELPGKANYFIGNDPTQWRTNVPTYAKVRYEDLYPGIDLVCYGNQRQLEYDFVVRPGADPSLITLGFQGADKLEVDAQGDLVLHTAAGAIRQRKPVIYQEVDGLRRDIAGGYVLREPHTVGFKVDAYESSRPLIVDPVLLYSTYLGGAGEDSGTGIAVDSAGNAYVTGITTSANFPTTAGAKDMTYNGGPPPIGGDTFVTKLNSSGTALVYSTYLGGSGDEPIWGSSIAVDRYGRAYVTGTTDSPDFPTTPGAYDTSFNGVSDAFVTKLNSSGSALVYSTYLGGTGQDGSYNVSAIAVDSAGNAYVTGFTDSLDFPTTPSAYDRSFNGPPYDAFVTKLNRSGTALVYSTYLGGMSDDDATGIAVDRYGRAYVTGYTASLDFPTTPGAYQPKNGGLYDAFVTKLNRNGSGLVYSTYLGGTGDDAAGSIAVDSAGNAYVTGQTNSPNFDTTAGAYDTTYNGGTFGDAFVTKLNSSGGALVYSTYLGGMNDDNATSIAVDRYGRAYVTGFTASLDFPTTPGAYQPTNGGGSFDAFVTKLNSDGSGLVYSTYLGGTGDDLGASIAVDWAGEAYVTGQTNSLNFDTTAGAYDTTYNGGAVYGDAFVTKLHVTAEDVSAEDVTADDEDEDDDMRER